MGGAPTSGSMTSINSSLPSGHDLHQPTEEDVFDEDRSRRPPFVPGASMMQHRSSLPAYDPNAKFVLTGTGRRNVMASASTGTLEEREGSPAPPKGGVAYQIWRRRGESGEGFGA